MRDARSPTTPTSRTVAKRRSRAGVVVVVTVVGAILGLLGFQLLRTVDRPDAQVTTDMGMTAPVQVNFRFTPSPPRVGSADIRVWAFSATLMELYGATILLTDLATGATERVEAGRVDKWRYEAPLQFPRAGTWRVTAELRMGLSIIHPVTTDITVLP